MTKIVKDYIEAKIREGAQPKKDELNDILETLEKSTPHDDDIDKAIYASDEYKALEAFIRKWAKEHHARVRSTAYRSNRLMNTAFEMNFEDIETAQKNVHKFSDKVDTVVRDAIVAMELSKSKEDIDQLIAKAVANLV